MHPIDIDVFVELHYSSEASLEENLRQLIIFNAS